MKTIEQLNALSDYEINCAVAEKLGKTIDHDHRSYGNSDDAMWYEGKTYHSAGYCKIPNDYMPIAIEHNITIDFSSVANTVCAVMIDRDIDLWVCSDDLPKPQAGRAVCIAYLLMEPPKEID